MTKIPVIKFLSEKLKKRQDELLDKHDIEEFDKQGMILDSYSIVLKPGFKDSGLLTIYEGKTKIADVPLYGKYLLFVYFLAKKRIMDKKDNIPEEFRGWMSKKEFIEHKLWDTPGSVGNGKYRVEDIIYVESPNLKDGFIQDDRKRGYRISPRNILIKNEISPLLIKALQNQINGRLPKIT